MLTNPAETQVVSSLGVKIGASAAEGDSAKCPFGDVVREMGAESDAGSVPWTREALTRLDNIPDFVRPMARQGIEHSPARLQATGSKGRTPDEQNFSERHCAGQVHESAY